MNKFTFANLSFFSGSIGDVADLVHGWIHTKNKKYICATGAHGVVESQNNPNVFAALSNGFVVPDGMPLVWIGKYLGFKNTQRIYGPDLMLALCESTEKNKHTVFLLGTTEQTLQKLKKNLILKFPKLKIIGAYAPPFDEASQQEKEKILNLINNLKPHIIFVGLSTPKQELWMHDNVDKLSTNLLVGVGAAFDFIAGTKKQAPKWIQKLGFEWLFRVVHEPKRLGKRYIMIILKFTYLVMKAI